MLNTCEVFKMWHKVVKNFNEFWQSELNEQNTAKQKRIKEKKRKKYKVCCAINLLSNVYNYCNLLLLILSGT